MTERQRSVSGCIRAMARIGRITVAAAAVMMMLTAGGALAAAPTAAPDIHRTAAITTAKPLLVVLCKFTDTQTEPHPPSYYEELFGEAGAGKGGIYDYWKDVSYGSITLSGTVVKGWYTIPNTDVAAWRQLGRAARIDRCASQAKDVVRFTDFAGVVVLTNQTGLSEDLFGGGPPITIAGTTYPALGYMDSEEDQVLNGILHESGHALGINHSRALSQQAPVRHSRTMATRTT